MTTFFLQFTLKFTFTFMHLADAFIQSDLQCIQAIIFLFSFFLSMGKKRLHIFVLLGQHVK